MSESVGLLNRTLSATDCDHLFVSFPCAEVSIETASQDTVDVIVRGVDVPHSNAAYEMWEAASFKARTVDGTMRLQISDPHLSHLNRSGHIKIALTIPENLSTHVRNIAGSIFARGLRHRTELESAAGKVDLSDCAGRLLIYAKSSALQLQHYKGDSVKINLAGGSLSASRIVATTFSLRASSSDISLNQIQGTSELRLNRCTTNISQCSPAPRGNLSAGSLQADQIELAQLHTSGTKTSEVR